MNSTRYRAGKAAHALAAAVACFLTGEASANPTGAEVVAGQVDIVNSPNGLLITNSPGAIINWRSFSILPGELTQFIQQSSSSSVLNRITGQDPTQILGALRSNGKVVLINPNGILFGASARVDVNGLVASTLDLSNSDFLAGRLKFNAAGRSAAIDNHGAITTPDGGQVYLIGSSVTNGGVITSPGGDVVLAAGQSVDLADSNNPDVRVVISAPGSEALNVGKVVAETGRVGIYGALVNQMGLVSANSAVRGANGKIVLKSSGDTILGAGSVTTATGAGNGGVVEATGTRVGLVGDALVDASGQTGGGTVLIGGDEHGNNPSIQNAELTYVGPSTRIKADALQAGDGGKIVVWSDRQTRMYGDLAARGGSARGNGGFVETSSKGYLDFHGSVDLRAPSGLAGMLLLDPSDITIQAAPSTGDVTVPSGAPFDITAANATSVLSVTDLQSALGLGNVTVTTSSNAAAPAGGTITVASPFSWSNANALSLVADSSIALNAPITASSGTLRLSAASGGITQSGGSITAAAVSAVASNGSVELTDPYNAIGVIAGHANAPLGFTLVNSNSFTVGTVGSVSGITSTFGPSVYGIVLQTPGGGDITIDAPVNAGASGALVGAGGGVVQGASGLISGSFLIANAGGIGGVGSSDAPLVTTVSTLKSANSAGDVYLDNSGDLTISFINAAGAVGVNTIGSLATSLPAACDCVSAVSGSSVALAAEGSVLLNQGATLSATNDVTVRAGYSAELGKYSTTDKTLTIDGSVSGSTIDLFSAGALTTSGTLSGVVTKNPSLGSDSSDPTGPVSPVTPTTPPTLAECSATPSLPGCGAVLPTLAACTASPATAGCNAVLPTLAACTADPAAAGCSAVLPTLATCSASPGMAGCSAVLPTLAACTADPVAAGCSAVLPTLTACIANPAATGCSVILPTLAACTAWPTTAGCSAVLPTLAQCTTTPSLGGCSSVLPSADICAVAPNSALCQVLHPPTQTSQSPVLQASKTIETIVASSGTQRSDPRVQTTPALAGSNATSSSDTNSDDSKSAKKADATEIKPGDKKDVPATKMYCN